MVNYNFIANETKEIVVDEKEANKIANDLLNDSVEIKENVNNTQQFDNNQENYLLEQFSEKKKKDKNEVNEEIEGFVNGGEYQSL